MSLQKIKLLFKMLSGEAILINVLTFSFVILSIVEIFFSVQFTEQEKVFSRFIANIVFLNMLHIGFTFFLIFETKAFLNWKKYSAPKFALSFHHKLLFLFICFWIFMFFHTNILYNIGPLLISFYAFYHGIKQHLGISLNLNHKYIQLNKMSNNFSKYFEHIFFNLLILISWTLITLKHFSSLKQMTCFYIQCSYFLIIFFYISINYILSGKEFFRKKSHFFPRLFIFPFLPNSFLALIGWASIHGMEYLFITKKFISLKTSFISLNRILLSFGFICFLNHCILMFCKSAFWSFCVVRYQNSWTF